ncbi:hypothetical protein JKP88DRAFT_244897 [Tribonema minus]|uniref:Uncharacterized protein n=1 Tax=Tribonema minus TaxID=303371 RepID=A0A835Z1Q5_9STRA|nr:hypothetical protein JKP88DRAFT_244897 [Tribonema minus]
MTEVDSVSVSEELLRAVANPYRCKDKFVVPGDDVIIDVTPEQGHINLDEAMMAILGEPSPHDMPSQQRVESEVVDRPHTSFRSRNGNVDVEGVDFERERSEEDERKRQRKLQRELERDHERGRECEREREREREEYQHEVRLKRERERLEAEAVEQTRLEREFHERHRDRDARRSRRNSQKHNERERQGRQPVSAERSPPSSGGRRDLPPIKQNEGLFGEDMAAFRSDFNKFNLDHQRETEALEKAELLAKMNQLEREGFPPIKRMTVNTALDDIRYELYRQTREANRARNLKSMRNYLVTASSLIEMANANFNPFELNLNGFSSAIMNSIEDYDPTLLALHHKYAGRGSGMAPEWQLAMSLTFAAIVHHTSGMATQPTRTTRGRSSDGVRRMAGNGGGGMGGVFSSLNPFSMLFNMVRGGGGGSATEPSSQLPKRSMHGPPSSGTDSD